MNIIRKRKNNLKLQQANCLKRNNFQKYNNLFIKVFSQSIKLYLTDAELNDYSWLIAKEASSEYHRDRTWDY